MAILERTITNIGDALRNGNGGHALTAVKCIGSNAGDTLRNGNGAQIAADVERFLTDGGDRFAVVYCRDHQLVVGCPVAARNGIALL